MRNLARIALATSLFLASCGGGSGGDGNEGNNSGSQQSVPAKPYITQTALYNEEPLRGIQLIIQDNSDNETGFVLERRKNYGSYSQLETFSQKGGTGVRFLYSDLGLDKNTNYTYRIRAYNNSGNSNWEEITETSSNVLTSSLSVKSAADTYVQKNYPTLNFGNLPYIQIQESAGINLEANDAEMGFLFFSLPTIPSYSEGIDSAELRLIEAGGGGTFYPGKIGIYAAPVFSSWNESTLKWNDYPSWEEVYSYGEHNPNLSTERQLFINVSNIVKSWYAGSIQNKGFVLFTTDSGKYCTYYARESGYNAGIPTLKVNYKW
ncbi:MAG: DNRLRE domain-containing protein [Nanoarchaeota archaeon]